MFLSTPSHQGDGPPHQERASTSQETFPRPDRVTLCPPSLLPHSLLDNYKATAAPAPVPNPYRFHLKRLGITETEFETRIATEVEETLLDLANKRRLDRLFADEIMITHPLVPLTKADCLRYFDRVGLPSTGALFGVYLWATDRDVARFNFDFNFDTDDISILDAYD